MSEQPTFWILLWKVLFIGTVLAFAGMSVWVIIGGWIDIKHLFRDLGGPREEGEEKD